MITTKGWQPNEKGKKHQRITEKEREEILDVFVSHPLHRQEWVLEMEASSHVEMMMLTKEIPRTNKSFIEKKHLLLYVCNGKYQKSKGPISFIYDIRNQEQNNILHILVMDFIVHCMTNCDINRVRKQLTVKLVQERKHNLPLSFTKFSVIL